MMLHDQLLEQARQLAELDPTRPRQANLRRAVSSAYYALFHLLVHEGSTLIAGDPRQELDAAICFGLRRWYDHAKMKRASEWFQGKKTPVSVEALLPAAATVRGQPQPAQAHLGTSTPGELRRVADAFVDLQQQRHVADYDLRAPPFDRQSTLVWVERAERAFEDWRAVRAHPLARLFLFLMLAGDLTRST